MTTSSDDGTRKGAVANEETQTARKLRYPRSVAFIVSNEFCERFNFYGMRTILVLYLNLELGYSKNDATVIFHTFAMFVYFMCIFGAFVSDSWLGKFKTILYLSLVYAAGSIIISLGAIPPLNLPASAMTLLGLALIAVGSGGIKPCVSAFGGDQFKLPEQVKQMATFFSVFYFSINLGSLSSTTVTPILRKDVHCFGNASCYPLAFGVPAILMTISIVVFVLGRPLYKSMPPGGNMFTLVGKAIVSAIFTRCKEKKNNPKPHWLDYAENKYDRTLIDDIKVLLRILVLYIPLPVFWALFDQQASRWTFQATRMDPAVGTIEIKPEQMQLINPFLILVFIPLYDIAIYPLLAKIGVRRPLQKLTIGGMLAGVAFIISGVVELELEKTYPVLPSPGFSQLRIFNGIPGCDYMVESNSPSINKFQIKSIDSFEEKFVDVNDGITFNYKMTPANNNEDCPSAEGMFFLENKEAISYFMYLKEGNIIMDRYIDYVDKPEKGDPEVRVLANLLKPVNVTFVDVNRGDVPYNEQHTQQKRKPIISSKYKVKIGDREALTADFLQGGEYTILLSETNKGEIKSNVVMITEPNSLSILWLIPQFFVITLGEVMFSVTGLEFSYSQAPNSMKSVLQACWQLTVAFGNLIVIIVAKTRAFNSQAYEFFLFAALMVAVMLLFMYLAYRYKPNNPNKTDEDNVTRRSISKADAVLNE